VSEQQTDETEQWVESGIHRGREWKHRKTVLERVRCPECGSEDRIIKTTAVKGQSIPPSMATKCSDCDYQSHGAEFHGAWERNRMSEEELEEMRKQRQKWEGEMVDYEYSAHGIATRRGP
jgi:hypothetical protein